MAQAMREEDYDLQRAWENACDAFVRTTSEDLKKTPKYSPDEVLEQIRAKQERDEEKNAKYQAAKDVLSKTLDCINNLGMIAAQGASSELFMSFVSTSHTNHTLSHVPGIRIKRNIL
jgi:hypothetical protein